MLLDRGLVFYRAQGAQVEALDGRPLQFGLEFGLDDRKVDVVVVQFVQNVEARVVSRVEFVGVERARRIERPSRSWLPTTGFPAPSASGRSRWKSGSATGF